MPAADGRSDAPRSRHERDVERVRHGVEAAQAEGQSAMAVALAQIGAAFDEAAVVNAFKIRVEQWLRLGPYHVAVRARFGARAAMLPGRDLDAAIVLAERWWRDERRAFQIASALGCATRLSLEVLSELRLVLRLLRFKQMRAEYHALIAAFIEETTAIAAE